MKSSPTPPKKSFFKEHVLPALFVFIIPGFSAWFFSYAEKDMDRQVLQSIERQVQDDREISAAERSRILQFYRTVPVSRIMASNKPDAAKMQAMFEPTKTRYAIFRWMQRIAWICLGSIAITFVIVGMSVAFSLRSQSAQYWSLRIGWPVLRTSAAIQVLGQGTLAVALSFWVTALLTHSYFIKLIGIIAVLAGVAAFALWKAIFAKVDHRCEVEGEIVSEAEAPALWQRVRKMAAKLQTATPDRIILGIVPSFFVTEHPVVLGNEVQEGRTLYLSLPMLKLLAVDEADAVLGHELAHFSGEDTLWSRKITPLTGKFAIYLRTLGEGLSLSVAHFMHLFWKLYNLSIRKLSREREFRADRVGADLVSADAMKRALLKITCYCEYRDETEMAIVKQDRVDPSLNLSQRLEEGYPAFATSFVQSDKAIDESVPHPFDTHPTLTNRLAELGFDARGALREAQLQEPAPDSWYRAISTAQSLEERLWGERQKRIQAFHSESLAWRLLPKDEEETAIVREHFPQAVFRKKDGAEAILDFDRIHLVDWTAPILFKHILSAKLQESWGKKHLTLAFQEPGAPKVMSVKLQPELYIGEKANLLAMFGHYYSRHKTAEVRSRQAAEGTPSA